MKKLLSLVLAILMMMTMFVGCSGDDALNDVLGDEEYYNVQFEAFYDDNGERLFSVVETMGDESLTVEYNNVGYIAYPNTKISDVLSENYTKDLKIVDEEGTFLGWLVFKETMSIDENGFENNESVKLENLYTTEEILDMEVVDCSYRFVARWSDIEDSFYIENGYDI